MAIGEIWSVRTIDEIQKSEYKAELASEKTPDLISRCMMQTLHGYSTPEGKRPYAEVEHREFGTTHDITLRTPQRPAAGMFDAGGELLFLIENSANAAGGTHSRMWVHQYVLSPPPQESLDTLTNVVKVCL
jgi:hypothetical protein